MLIFLLVANFFFQIEKKLTFFYFFFAINLFIFYKFKLTIFFQFKSQIIPINYPYNKINPLIIINVLNLYILKKYKFFNHLNKKKKT